MALACSAAGNRIGENYAQKTVLTHLNIFFSKQEKGIYVSLDDFTCLTSAHS